jgi:hypothetical protein
MLAHVPIWLLTLCVLVGGVTPLLATFLLGMFWVRATGHGAFWGSSVGRSPRRCTTKSRASPRVRRCYPSRIAAHLPLGHGAELLGRHLGMDRVLRADGRDQRRDGAADEA